MWTIVGATLVFVSVIAALPRIALSGFLVIACLLEHSRIVRRLLLAADRVKRPAALLTHGEYQ